MRSYDVFFFGALFFLLGVLAGSGGWRGEAVWLILAAAAACLILRKFHGVRFAFKRWDRNGWLVLAALFLFIPAGVFFYAADDARFHRTELPEGERTLEAEVVSLPVVREGTQEVVLEFSGSRLRVFAKLPAHPRLTYGDALAFTGRIEEPFSDSYRSYLAKERVRGVVAFPELVAHEPAAWSFRGALYALRDAIVNAFRRTLPAKEAALMAGITVGAREDFSESFKDAMAKSGTTHLVALSGYNITVVVMVAMALFLLVLPRRFAFLATLAVVLSFVLMTGAEASVVRAALMGGIALLAKHMGRKMDVRNAIMLAALAMVLVNPKVLAFDLGFQLSFLALCGLVYLKPAFDRLLGWEEKKESVLSWRENLTTTAAAQFAVAPLLIYSFGSVSLTSLAANVLILGVVPFTMGLGFMLAAVSFFSLFFAELLAFLAFALLKFQTLMIELFATLAVPVGGAFSAGTAVLYYGGLILLVWYAKRSHLIPRGV